MLLQAVVLHLDLTFLASYNNASLTCSIFITHKEIHLRFTCSKATYVLKCIAPCSSHDNSSFKSDTDFSNPYAIHEIAFN